MSASPTRLPTDVRISLWLGLVVFLIYNANLRTIGAGDTLPARYLPFGIWHHGTLLLDPIRDSVIEGHEDPYWMVPGRAGHTLSLYPIVLPVLATPLYLPAIGYLHFMGGSEWRLRAVATVMEKLISSWLAAWATALLFLLLRRRTSLGDALLLALAFGLGTNTWMISSQALWQHGLAELLLVGVLYLITGPCTSARALAAGLLCGLIVGNRPPDVLLVAGLFLYGLRWARNRQLWLVVGAAIPLAAVLGYNLVRAGNPFGPYVTPNGKNVFGGGRLAFFFRNGLLSGAAGLLFSPARGLFVFAPFLLLVPAALVRGWRDRHARALTLAIGAGVLIQILFYAKADWRAGYSWGPRWLTDAVPLLVWLLPPALAALRATARLTFVLAVCASVAVQAVGAFYYTSVSDLRIFVVPRGHPDEMRAAWNPRNTPFWVELQHDRAQADPAFSPWLVHDVQGNIDLVTTGDGPTETVAAGAPLTLAGWALTDYLSPAAVEVTLDGHPRGVTRSFFERPDVRATLHVAAPAGWNTSIDTDGVEPGTHVLAVTARFRGSAIAMPVAQREITVVSDDAGGVGLAAAARRASALLKEHQQPAGFWLTSHTSVPRFEAPRQEMNTFLTSMMIDLLAPVAAQAGLSESVAHARGHLDGQIEANGLVRYHGRPNASTIPALGCAITPDADDTALVWRLVGHRGPSLLQALAVLKQYRTAEGLYRTWLAPRERYECIDPGRDANPTDATIQMHVFLFLAQSDPAAAHALCDALDTALAEDRLWVYYDKAPLIPLLRQADLGRAGCPLRMPEARLRTTVTGQEDWLIAGRLVNADGLGSRSSETPAVLRRLAKDDFAFVRQAPPLLYHNDLTATVRRFYWSEDFGYALWLRLYFESARRQDDGA